MNALMEKANEMVERFVNSRMNSCARRKKKPVSSFHWSSRRQEKGCTCLYPNLPRSSSSLSIVAVSPLLFNEGLLEAPPCGEVVFSSPPLSEPVDISSCWWV